MASSFKGRGWQLIVLTIVVIVGLIVAFTAPLFHIRNNKMDHDNVATATIDTTAPSSSPTMSPTTHPPTVSPTEATLAPTINVTLNVTNVTFVVEEEYISKNPIGEHLLDTHEFFHSHATISSNDERKDNNYYYYYYNTTNNKTIAITPLFWHIPKTGSTTSFFDRCLKFVMASQIGKRFSNETELRIVTLPSGIHVVNIDTTSIDGIEHANHLGFNVGSDIYDYKHFIEGDDAAPLYSYHNNNENSNVHVDVIVAVRLRPAIKGLFNINHQGVLFTMLRHPIQRAVSLFYYLRDATKKRTYNPALRNMTLLEYFQGPEKKENNWITRMLSGVLKGRLNNTHLEQAKYIIQSKTVIGIFEELDLSLRVMGHYFQWDNHYKNDSTAAGHHNTSIFERCLGEYVQIGSNMYNHPQIMEGTPEWEAAKVGLEYDIELYNYAVEVFHNQSIAFGYFDPNNNTSR